MTQISGTVTLPHIICLRPYHILHERLIGALTTLFQIPKLIFLQVTSDSEF